jgi:hypothetical protein
MLTPASGLYFMNMFGRLAAEAAADPHVRARSQAWINQQVHAAIRANESAALTPARQKEIEHEDVPLISAVRGVSYLHDVYGESLWVLMGVVVLVLLIACANLANFLLARAATRQREIATRLALGSSRSRIARQSLIETLLLSVGGGLLGLAMAFAATRVLIAFVSQGSARIAVSPAPNVGVLLFTFGVSVITGILFGLGPAIAAARTASHDSLSSTSRTSGGGRPSRGFFSRPCATCNTRTTASSARSCCWANSMRSLPVILRCKQPISTSVCLNGFPLFPGCNRRHWRLHRRSVPATGAQPSL